MARTKPLLAALAVALVAAGAAQANKIRIVPADKAIATRAVLKKADLGAGWKGGATKPDLSSSTGCKSFDPKDSDLVTTGAAASSFSNGAFNFESDVDVLQASAMVRKDWARSIKPAAVTCLKEAFSKELGANAKLVYAARTTFPRIAPMTANFRLTFDVTSGGQTVRLFLDALLFGKGRAEGTLLTVAPQAATKPVRAAEVRLARLIASRLPAA